MASRASPLDSQKDVNDKKDLKDVQCRGPLRPFRPFIYRTMSLNVIDLQKVYDNTVALSSLTFDVVPGSVTGLLGPNGAGKTTTMRIVTGIIPATRGSAIVAGFDIAKEPIAAKQRIAYVPDDPKLFDTLTVWEHLDFVAAAYQVKDFAKPAEILLQRFELESKRNTIRASCRAGCVKKSRSLARTCATPR